jgi:molybdenum cofactor cytidylyltransferase
LLTAVTAEGVRVATPSYRGRGGHPVVARESLLQEFRRGYSGTLRQLVRSADAQRCRLDVDDAAVAVDLDTPADLAVLHPGLVPRFANSSTGWFAAAATNMSR